MITISLTNSYKGLDARCCKDYSTKRVTVSVPVTLRGFKGSYKGLRSKAMVLRALGHFGLA